jgi:hypothetical protein
MPKAPDTPKYIALYADKAFHGTPGNYGQWLGNTAREDYLISRCLQKGFNLIYITNTSYIGATSPGYLASQYTSSGKASIRNFVAKCTLAGIEVGVVIGINDGSNGPNLGPANRVKDYNQTAAANQKLTRVLVEEEYWNNGQMTFTVFRNTVQQVFNLLDPVNVKVDAYLANWDPGELPQLTSYLDIYWLTEYTNIPRYDRIRSGVQELAGTTPVTPIKVGALVSAESYERNAAGVNTVNNNFQGYWLEGKRVGSPYTPPQPIVTSKKSMRQMSDMITHNGTVGLPPIDFNAESTSVTNYIDWQGIQMFSYTLFDPLDTADNAILQVFATGDGAVSTANVANLPIAQQVAALVPYNASRFLYLGDVYDTGTQADFINSSRSYDKIYGTQSPHNLLIISSATPGDKEWANRGVGYDAYWTGALAGIGSVQPVWDGDRTTNNPRYYSFFIGNWKFICINSMEDGFATGGVASGSAMHTWLVNELNTPSNDKRKIVFCHHPRFSADNVYGDNANMQPLWAAMQGKALILLSGHAHNYQLHKMRDASGNLVTGGGVYQVVSGTGGDDLYGWNLSYNVGGQDPIQFKRFGYGLTRITLSDTEATVCFIDNNGVTYNCTSLPVQSNATPIVSAGPDQTITFPATATMTGSASDDGNPNPPGNLQVIWTKVSGPGNVTFSDPAILNPVATFSASGTYVLRLTANDSQYSAYDDVTIFVNAGPTTRNIGVSATGTSGTVLVTLSVADIYGNQNGNAPISRVYSTAVFPTMSVPATVGTESFIKWQRDGADFSFNNSITISDTINHNFVAVYGPNPVVTLCRVLINSNLGASISSGYYSLTPDDVYGRPSITGNPFNGTVVLYYYAGTTIDFEKTFSFNTFVQWNVNGLFYDSNSASSITITADTEITAIYDLDGNYTLTIDVTDALCPLGNATMTAITPDPGTYTYEWSDDGFVTVFATTASVVVATLLSGKFYLVRVTETTSSYANDVQIDGVAVISKSSIDVAFDVIPAACGSPTGSIMSNVSGGTHPYSFLWSNGAITRGITDTPGPYTLSIVDANGCAAGPFASSISSSSSPVINAVTASDVSCNGGFNGSLIADVIGGSAPIYYQWTYVDDPTLVIPNSDVISGLPAGSYDLTVIDAYGCTDSVSGITLSEPTALTLSETVVDVSCNGASDGSIQLSASGGTGPYQYDFGDGPGPSDTISGISAGVYVVSVIDSNGCITSKSITVSQPNKLTGTIISNIPPTCFGGNGTVTVNPVGGTAPYQYSLDFGPTDPSPVLTAPAGPHDVIIYDANGCNTTVQFTITQPSAPVQAAATISSPTVIGGSDGSIVLSVSGGTPGYSYLWSTGDTSKDLYSLSAGVYSVAISDSLGCTSNYTFTVNDPSIQPPIDPPGGGGYYNDAQITSLLSRANCCFADKVFKVFTMFRKGNPNVDCFAIPAMILGKQINMLRRFYYPDTIIPGSEGVYAVDLTEFTASATLVMTLPGFVDPVVDYIYTGSSSADKAAILNQVEDSGLSGSWYNDRLFIYSPPNSFYNGLNFSFQFSGWVTQRPRPVTRNGFVFAVDQCDSNDMLICIDENDMLNLVEQILKVCDGCHCKSAAEVVKDGRNN